MQVLSKWQSPDRSEPDSFYAPFISPRVRDCFRLMAARTEASAGPSSIRGRLDRNAEVKIKFPWDRVIGRVNTRLR
jgi:hypothetical protein